MKRGRGKRLEEKGNQCQCFSFHRGMWKTDQWEVWLTGVGVCSPLVSEVIHVCVRKIEMNRRSPKSLSSTSDSNDCAVCPLTLVGHSMEPSATTLAFLPQGQVSLAVKWLSVSPSQCKNHREVDFSLCQWLLFIDSSIMTKSIAAAARIHIRGFLRPVWFPLFISDTYRTSVQVIRGFCEVD